MLDKATSSLLNYFINQCGTEYRVLEKKEIADSLKSRFVEQQFSAQLKFLKRLEMINIKYMDDEEVCLAPTPKAMAYVEDKRTAQAERFILDKSVYKKLFQVCFWASVLGGAVVAAAIMGFGAVVDLIQKLF